MRASQLVRLFPRGWRARYGEEFLATAGDDDLRPRQVLDIAASAFDAWISPEVRRATREFRTTVVAGEPAMTRKLMTSCGTTAQPTTRDALLGAVAMIGGALLFSIGGLVARRNGLDALGKSLVTMAFPFSLLCGMPFLYLRGRPWSTQVTFVVVPMLILAGIAYITTLG